MAYIKEILPKTSCPKFILQDNGTKLKNKELITCVTFGNWVEQTPPP